MRATIRRPSAELVSIAVKTLGGHEELVEEIGHDEVVVPALMWSVGDAEPPPRPRRSARSAPASRSTASSRAPAGVRSSSAFAVVSRRRLRRQTLVLDSRQWNSCLTLPKLSFAPKLP
jgi:hypothetical protein